MSQTIETTVTPSTSLILIRNVSTQNIVYLPSYNYADFSVTVRDTTGNSRIVNTPVVLSTTNDSLFFDGSSRYNLNQPYGLVNLALRNSNRWQIVHTSGQSPANSAANVETVNISTAFFSLVSTAALSLSTLTLENLSTPNTIQLTGPLIIQNLSTYGFVQMQSTLTVYGNTLLNTNLYVSAAARFLSTAYVQTFVPFSSIFSFGSSFAIGGNLAVGDTTIVLDTLYTQSTVQAYTVQIKQSTGTVLNAYNTLSVITQFSSLGYLSVGTSTIARRNATITGNVSTLGGVFKTNVLSPTGSADLIVNKNLQVEGPLIVYGSFYNKNNLAVNNTINISSFFDVNGSFSTIYFSSPSLSTSGSLSTLGALSVSDSIFVNGNVSTIQTNSQGNLSVDGRFIVNSTISSLNTLYTYGNINIGCNAYLGNISVQSLFVAGDMTVNGNVSLSSAIFKKNVTVTGVMSVDGTTNIGGSIGVAEDAYIGTFLDARVNSYYSTLNSVDYLLSNLDITTSSPFITFTASTLFVSSLYTKQLVIQEANLYRSSTYGSTIYVPRVEAENIALSSLITNSFIFGRNIPANIDSRFILNVPSYFTKGIQTIELRASTISNARFIGSHVGDGSQITNAPVPYNYLSGLTMLASTITSGNLYTSSFNASTLVAEKLLYVQSNALLPNLRIDPVGYPAVSNTNQILSLTNKTMGINNTVYFDNQNTRIGINISTPTADLDIAGTLYASNVSYSSINNVDLSGVTVTLSSLQAGNTYLANYLQYGDSGLYVGNFYPNVEAGTSNYPIRIWNSESVYKTNFGFQNANTASTIVINSGLLIYRDTRRVGVNTINFASPSPTSTGTIYKPQYTLDVRGSMYAEEGYFSTMNITKQLTTECLEVPNLQMYGRNRAFLNRSTNTFLTSSTTFLIDRFATFTRQGLGINNAQPIFALDVRGSGFFSTLFTTNLRANSVGLMYQDL
jgi:hypothetical protein